MNTKIKFLLIICSLISDLCWSQTGDTITIAYIGTTSYETDYSAIKKVQEPKLSDYQGSYHFGESEAESTLEIIFSNGKLFSRTQYGDWEEKEERWVLKSDRDDIKSAKDHILFGKHPSYLYQCIQTTEDLTKGDFFLVSHSFDKINGKNYHYIQLNYLKKVVVPKGKYPETSFVKLTDLDMASYSKDALKIMRNEIFARNGHIFKTGGKMDRYFSEQKWYHAIKKTAKPILNDIENHNIQLILKFEQQ